MIVAQLFGVGFVCIHLMLFELSVREKKKKKKKKKRKRRRPKSKFSCSIFSTVRKSNGTLGLYFT